MTSKSEKEGQPITSSDRDWVCVCVFVSATDHIRTVANQAHYHRSHYTDAAMMSLASAPENPTQQQQQKSIFVSCCVFCFFLFVCNVCPVITTIMISWWWQRPTYLTRRGRASAKVSPSVKWRQRQIKKKERKEKHRERKSLEGERLLL